MICPRCDSEDFLEDGTDFQESFTSSKPTVLICKECGLELEDYD